MTPPAHQSLPLLGAKPGVLVEIVPGKKVALLDPDPLPGHCLAELIATGGGSYRVVPRPVVEWVDMGRASRARLGITLSENTLRRLGRGGFIRVRQVSPSRYEFNLQSWLDHCRAVESDDEFWTRPDPRTKKTSMDRYREAL